MTCDPMEKEAADAFRSDNILYHYRFVVEKLEHWHLTPLLFSSLFRL